MQFTIFAKKTTMKNTDTPKETLQVLKQIGTKVRIHRKAIESNYETFAKKHNLNKVTISRIENGENFTMSSLIQVLKIFDITLEDFFKDIK